MELKAIFLLPLIDIVAAYIPRATENSIEAENVGGQDGKQYTDAGKIFDQEVTGSDLDNVTRIHMKAERTPIPESDVLEAINLDYGRYTPMNFQYYNDQNMFQEKNHKRTDGCVDQWIKCSLSVVLTQSVCVVNHDKVRENKGIHLYSNYCDLYYDNCIHQYRYWRVFDMGKCFHPRPQYRTNVWDLMRPLSSLQNK